MATELPTSTIQNGHLDGTIREGWLVCVFQRSVESLVSPANFHIDRVNR